MTLETNSKNNGGLWPMGVDTHQMKCSQGQTSQSYRRPIRWYPEQKRLCLRATDYRSKRLTYHIVIKRLEDMNLSWIRLGVLGNMLTPVDEST